MSRLDDCPKLARLEWETWIGPKHRLIDCRTHEYTREIPLIWSVVQRWRAKTDDQSFEGLVELDKRCRAPVMSRVFPTWPEWPSRPFLFVPAAECERRFAILYPGDEEALCASCLSPDPALLLDGEEGFRNLVTQLQKGWEKDRTLHVYPTAFESHELLRIPWWKTDTELSLIHI